MHYYSKKVLLTLTNLTIKTWNQQLFIEIEYIYTNICSIIFKFSEFQLAVDNIKPPIIYITETLRKENIPGSIISIPNL